MDIHELVKAALTEGATVFRPGLLAAAHGGVLYVDEVNLLPDHLVDVLLDVAASGLNRVERDGVSHSHPARFVLVGSMNPEEGELRPQLLDRFGLSVPIKAPVEPRARAEVVRRRLTHDAGGRQVETVFHDGTKVRSGYDARGRLASRTDQLGRTTRYEYDDAGRLTAVVDALGQRTEYAYDEAGNLVRQKDANGHVTRHEYDVLVRWITSLTG